MKRSKGAWLIGFIIIFGISISIVYYFFFTVPSDAPSNKKLIVNINKELMQHYTSDDITKTTSTVTKIQATTFLEDTFLFVPFQAEREIYGYGLFEWRLHKWELVLMNTQGTPRLVKLDPDDTSSYYFIWNMHPNDAVDAIDFYLLQRRNYSISGTIQQYSPGVQMKHHTSLGQHAYGSLTFPKQWGYLLQQIHKTNTANQFVDIMNTNFYANGSQIGWITLDGKGEPVTPEHTFNSGQISTHSIQSEYMQPLYEDDLEKH